MGKQNILIATAEAAPFARIGELGDMTSLLAKNLLTKEASVSVILPLYRSVREMGELNKTGDLSFSINGETHTASVWAAYHEKVQYYFIANDELYNRDSCYQKELREGLWADYEDNLWRFAFFSKAVTEACKILPAFPDIIHCYAWHTALIPVFLKTLYARQQGFQQLRTILTLPHMAFQGLFPAENFHQTGLPDHLFASEYLEYYGMFNLLKGGILFADYISTISPSYAEEIQHSNLGCGLEGVLSEHRHKLKGILNGIDYKEWEPAHDPYIYGNQYTARRPGKKQEVKKHFLEATSLENDPKLPLIVFTEKLEAQKGMQLIETLRDFLISLEANILFNSEGAAHYIGLLSRLAEIKPGRVHLCNQCHDTAGLHRLMAAADILLHPSEQDPSGLHTKIACRYGTVPIVYLGSASADVIRDNENGITFSAYTPELLQQAMEKALESYKDKNKWKKLQQNAMNTDVSWQQTARAYHELYGEVLSNRDADSTG